MAFEDIGLQDPNKKKEDEEKVNLPPTSPLAQASTSPQVTPQAATSGGRRLQNLQNYLKANKPQSQALGQQIVGKVGTDVEKAQQKLAQSQQRFSQQIQPEQQRLSQGGQVIQSALGAEGTQPGQAAMQFVQDPNQVKEFQNLFQGQSFLPVTGLSDADKLQAQASQLGQTAGLAGTEAGRFQLLKKYFGKPTYTTGQQRLDQLLLQGGGGLGDLQSHLRNQAQQAERSLSAGIQGARQQAGQLGQQREQLQQQAQGILGQQDQLNTLLQDELTQARQQQQQALPELLQRISQNKVTSQDLELLGLTPDQASPKGVQVGYARPTFGVENQVSEFFRPTQDFNLKDVTSPEEMARLRALSQLSGRESELIGQIGDESQLSDQYRSFLEAREGQSLEAARKAREDAFKSQFGGMATEITDAQERALIAQQILNRFNPGALESEASKPLESIYDEKERQAIFNSLPELESAVTQVLNPSTQQMENRLNINDVLWQRLGIDPAQFGGERGNDKYGALYNIAHRPKLLQQDLANAMDIAKQHNAIKTIQDLGAGKQALPAEAGKRLQELLRMYRS